MGTHVGKATVILLVLMSCTAILEAGEFITPTGQKIHVLSPYEIREPNPTEEQQVRPGESGSDPQDVTPCLVALPENPPDYYDLKQYQTSVKNQNPRGSCQTFAWIGAMEAFYKRKYGLELDLSEEYFIHMIYTVQHSYNPNLLHPSENIVSFCTFLAEGNDPLATSYNPLTVEDGVLVMVKEGLTLPEEKYAPYFGDIYSGGTPYSNHTGPDLEQIVADSNIILKDANGHPLKDKDGNLICNLDRTQQDIDNYEYDPRHIPLEARKNAIYGVTKMLRVSENKYRDTAILEKFIYSGQEVYMGFDVNHLVYSGKYSDGNSIFVEVTNHKDTDPDPCEFGCGGHQMLLVGYDRKSQLFLFKNSWGSSKPYAWIAYDFIKKYPSYAAVIREVRDPSLGPNEDAMWIGKWKLDYDGWLGDLVIRRTKKTRFENVAINSNDYTCINYEPSSEQERLGTFYGTDGVAHEVKGRINSTTKDMELYIDFVHPEPKPYANGHTVTINPEDQPFELDLFAGGTNSYTLGNFAAGLTTWNGDAFGALINRPGIELPHSPDNFSVDKWKNGFKLYFSNGSRAILEITDIGSLSADRFPVTFKYNGVSGPGFISFPDSNHFASSAGLDLYYHTGEAGIVSGLGVFGRSTSFIGVTEVSATDGAYSDKVQITWAPLQGAKLYAVYASTSPSGTKENLSDKIKTTTFDHKAAVPGQVYYYWVTAQGEDGDWTDWSDYDSGYRKLAVPTGVAASDGTYTDKVLITWNPVQGTVLYYTVVRREEGTLKMDQVVGSTGGTSFSDTTAIPGLQYYYTVHADSFYGTSAPSKSDKGYRKLAAPTNVVASDADAPLLMGKVLIQWSGVPGATSYSVYRSTSLRSRSLALLGTTTAQSYEDSTGTPEVIYYYSVKANNAYGSSDLSAQDAGHRGLPAPTGVSASDGIYEDKVVVTWNPVDGATSYLIFRADDKLGTRTQLGTASSKSTRPSFNDPTASLGVFYYYWVKAMIKSGTSDFSDPWDTGYRKLPVPTGVSASDGTYPDKVRITWNPVQGAAQYLIYRSTSSTGGQSNIGGSVTTTYDDTTALSGTTYYYSVCALWSYGGSLSGYSVPDAGWRAVEIPASPTLLSPANGATGVSTNPTFTWTASRGAASYQLQVATDSGFTQVVVNQSGITGTSQAGTELHGGGRYYWRVNATNAGGTSPWSETWSFTTTR